MQKKGRKGENAHLAALRYRPFFAIKHADGSNSVFPELLYEAVPSQDVPVFVGHGCKVESLRDESAISEKEQIRRIDRGGKAFRRYITRVLLDRDWRRLGSCVITCGLLG